MKTIRTTLSPMRLHSSHLPPTRRLPPWRGATLLLSLFSGAGLLLAQPQITVQPRSVTAFLGGEATFRVHAWGTGTVSYQWQFEGRDLPAATNATLVVGNVTAGDLGCYTACARDDTGVTQSQPAWLKLARWTELIVFEASISWANVSGGKSWVEWFQERTCLSAGQTHNYTTGRATTADVRAQIGSYLRSYRPGPNTLLATWWAGLPSDLTWQSRSVDFAVSNYLANLALLAEAGGKLFLLPNLPPLYWNPGMSNAATLRIDYTDLNARMERGVERLQAAYGLSIYRFDFAALCAKVLANPLAYGFTNITHQGESLCPPGDPDKFLWWSTWHWSKAAQHIFSDEIYRTLTPPLLLTPPTRSVDGVLTVQWEGGSGPFRLEHTDDFVHDGWQAEPLSHEREQWIPAPSSTRFFRVLQLGQ